MRASGPTSRRGRLGSPADFGEWRASDRSELWDRREQGTEFGWGQRQQAALVRHCVLTGFSRLSSAAGKRSTFERFPHSLCRGLRAVKPAAPASPVVRSIAYVPGLRQCPNRDFDATLTSVSARTPTAQGGLPSAGVGPASGGGPDWFRNRSIVSVSH